MKFLLIGTIVKDRINFLDGMQLVSPGGLTHSINAALAVCDPEDRLVPVSRIGEDLNQDLQTLWPGALRVPNNGFIPFAGLNNCVELNYLDENERIEKSLNPMPPLTFQEIEPFLDVDVVMVNLISGWDVDLEFMKKLRSAFNGLIALDIHSLALERQVDGTRKYRKVKNVESWIDSADIIQLNEHEFKMIAGNTHDAEIFFRQTCTKKEKIINLTMGSHGSRNYRIKNNKCKVLQIKPDPNLTVIDPIGCGDTFFSVFGVIYGKTQDINYSTFIANKAAGIAGSVKGLADSFMLRQMLKSYTREDG